MNYFEFLNLKMTTTGSSAGYSITPYNNQGVNPFVSTPLFFNTSASVGYNGVSIFTSAKKDDLDKIDYEKVLGMKNNDNTTENVQLSPLEFVLKEFFALDKVKTDADKNGDGEISVEEAQDYVKNLAEKDGNGEVLSLEDFEALIKEKGIDLERIADFLNSAQEQDDSAGVQQGTQSSQASQPSAVQHTSTSSYQPAQNHNDETKVQMPAVKTIESMTLPELKEEKVQRLQTRKDKLDALKAVRNGENKLVKQAKSQLDTARQKYNNALKSDPTAKKYAKKIIKNQEKIQKNQIEIDKNAMAITLNEEAISTKESTISTLEGTLSALEGSLSKFPSPTGKPEDKEKDEMIKSRKSALQKEIKDKKENLKNQKSDLAKLQKENEKLNKEKVKLNAEKQKLEQEKTELENLVNKNCSQAVREALAEYQKAEANYKTVKLREETKALNAYNKAKTAVAEVDAKIAARETEAAGEKYSLSDKADRAVELAESQLGVSEDGSSNDSAEIRKYKNGSVDGNPWCASFVSWLYGAGQGSSNSKTFGYTASSQAIKQKAISAGCYASANTGYVPKKGDLAMWTKSSSTGHVGIVTKVYPDGSFDTIEGNSQDAVTKHHYDSQSSVGGGFNGFVQMDKWLA